MSTIRKSITIPVAIVMALATAPLLTACVNPIQGIVQGVTGGKVQLPGASLPADFPKADVPLADGQVIFGISAGSGTDKGWNVSIRISDASQITAIQSQLESAGYTVQVTGSGGTDGGGLAATGPKYSVVVVIAKDDKGAIANYTVAPTTSGN
jgi:hypothetical protein